MTYKTKNATIVFAFVAMLMVAPLTISNANAADDMISSSSPVCGFVTSNISMTQIVRGQEQAESTEAIFAPTGNLNSATGTFSVTASTDWLGVGARADGIVTMASVEAGDTVTADSQVYTAATGDQSADNTKFSIDGSDEDVAESLAVAINARDSDLRATTDTTDAVTIKAFVRGTGGNSIGLESSEGTRLAVTSVTTDQLDGGGAGNTDHLDAENTKFHITKDGTTTSQSVKAYSAKTAFNAPTVAQEMVGVTNIDKNLRLTLQTSTVPTATATGTLILASVDVSDTVTVNGLVYTAIGAGKAGDNTKFDQSGTDIQAATDLADSIENDARVGLFGDVGAASGGTATVTVTHDNAGIFGNSDTILESTTGARITASGMTGGAEPLRNLPYDGALTMEVTFTVNCG